MNLDANVQKIIALLLKKWRILFVFGLIGVLLAFFYTANFTRLTYASSVEFLAYAVESQQEFNDSSSTSSQQQASNTSKMNYAMKMMDTYIELFKTNEFNQKVADKLNETLGTAYSSSFIKSTMNLETINDTAMFKITVTTNDPDLSYQIAHQLEETIPDVMKTTNNGLVSASVEDAAIKPASSQSRGYVKKCAVGLIAGLVLASAFLILKELLDVRVKTTDELTERYKIPVLGAIPEFEFVSGSAKKMKKGDASNE